MQYWIMKSEPGEYSIDMLSRAPSRQAPWTGVRNYQARNYLRSMETGDRALFWHSSCPAPGIVGEIEIVRTAYPDPTQFEPVSEYFDPKSSPEAPRWTSVEVRLVRTLDLVSPTRLREVAGLEAMVVLRKGNRLSVSPVTAAEWEILAPLLHGTKIPQHI